MTIGYTRVGHGPALVLLHGGMEDRRAWLPQLDHLAKDFTLYLWDAPGCGVSDDPPVDWRMPQYADAVAGWLAEIGVERAAIGGVSWGSTLALEVYRRHPQLVSALVLVGAYAGWAGSLPPEEVKRRLDALLEELQLPAEQWASAYIPTMLTDNAPQEVRDVMAALMAETRVSGALPMLRAMAAADLRSVLGTIRVPTLLLYGEHDVRSPLEVAEQMHVAIPGSRLVVVPGAGHCCNAEAPGEFNRAVREFLRSVGTGSG